MRHGLSAIIWIFNFNINPTISNDILIWQDALPEVHTLLSSLKEMPFRYNFLFLYILVLLTSYRSDTSIHWSLFRAGINYFLILGRLIWINARNVFCMYGTRTIQAINGKNHWKEQKLMRIPFFFYLSGVSIIRISSLFLLDLPWLL